jgi:two-component system, chemotaxis family, protein-glutamate methylesterase/glutaminase
VANRNLIVIGASAGGIEALSQILSGLPVDLDAALLIVLHTSNHTASVLPQIFERAGKLPALHPRDGTPIEKGHVYIAVPGFHMIVEGNLLRVIQGPKENLYRPAIDPLFRSAAAAFGPKVIGLILTGSLDDGTAGLMVVAARGGAAIIQDPETALFPAMPRSALEQVPNAQVLPLAEIPNALVNLVSEQLHSSGPGTRAVDPRVIHETRIAEFNMSEIENEGRPGHPSAFACPDCGGVLWELEENGFLRFRCRVGHAYTERNLDAEQRNVIESALWSALRALEENASLYRRMADRSFASHRPQTAEQFEDRAANTEANARVLRDFLLRVNENPSVEGPADEESGGAMHAPVLSKSENKS